MNGDRAASIWTRIASRAQRDESAISPKHACLACVEALEVSGAGLVLTGSMNSFEQVYVTDSYTGEVEELQATLGQGPGIDALDSGMPVLVGDLDSPANDRLWPMFAPAARRLGIRTIYSLPLALGAIRVGVLDLYSNEAPRELMADQLMDALVYADTALLLVLDTQSGIVTSVHGHNRAGPGPVLWHAEVHQAAGMLSAQLGIPVLDALVQLRAYAYRRDQRLTDVARSVVERRLRLRPGGTEPARDHDRAP